MANVKFQYTVRIENLPSEVRKKMLELSYKTKQLASSLEQTADKDEGSTTEIIKDIDSLRQEITLIDLNLEDCYNLLVGLENYKLARLQKNTLRTNVEESQNVATNE